MLVDIFEGEIDMAFLRIDVQYLADDLLSFPDMVSDVLNPAAGDLRDRDQPFLIVVLVKGDKGYKILYILDRARRQVRLFLATLSPALPAHSNADMISALISAFPPVGVART